MNSVRKTRNPTCAVQQFSLSGPELSRRSNCAAGCLSQLFMSGVRSVTVKHGGCLNIATCGFAVLTCRK